LLSRRRVDENGCWLYTEQTDIGGYGVVRFQGKRYKVHKLAALIWHDDYNEASIYCHKNFICKSKSCFNPEHIYKGTYSTNRNDAIEIYPYLGGDKHNSLKTHCSQGHEYSEENTYYINTKNTKSRQCKKCRKLRYLLAGK